MLQWLIDIAKTSSDAVPAAATGTRFARGLALMAFLVHRYTAPMVLMAVLVIGVVIPTAAGATIAELCASFPSAQTIVRFWQGWEKVTQTSVRPIVSGRFGLQN